jgi:uncharacterized protein (DUF1800 family)
VPTNGNYTFQFNTARWKVYNASLTPPLALGSSNITIQYYNTLSNAWLGWKTRPTDAQGYLTSDPYVRITGTNIVVERARLRVTIDGVNYFSTEFTEPGDYGFFAAKPSLQPWQQQARHVVDRLTFGVTPALLTEISGLTNNAAATNWINAFIAAQLNPASISNADFDAYMASNALVSTAYSITNNPTTNAWFMANLGVLYSYTQTGSTYYVTIKDPTLPELRRWTYRHQLLSARQLQEVMTMFWDNHFSTRAVDAAVQNYVRTPGTNFNTYQFDAAENISYRAHAFGRFRDLVEICCKSPAMGLYLNNQTSRGNGTNVPNENFARELLELYTFGKTVTGNTNLDVYGQNEVVAAAKILTGWKYITAGGGSNLNDIGMFQFDPGVHSSGNKTMVLAGVTHVITNRTGISGELEGQELLDIIVSKRATAEFISRKLCQVFVNDSPSATLVSNVANVFQSNINTSNQMAVVLNSIFTSSDFLATTNQRAKVRTPLELAIATGRNLGADTGNPRVDNMINSVINSGMGTFDCAPPTGYPEVGSRWISTANILTGARDENAGAYNAALDWPIGPNQSATYDVCTWLSNRGADTEEEIILYLSDLITGGNISNTEYQRYLATLRNGGTFTFANNATTERKLRLLIGAMLASPEFWAQ